MIHIILLHLSLILYSCETSENSYHFLETKEWISGKDKLKVLSTIGMINDLVCEIGGEQILCLTLIKGEMDPHSYQLVKGDDEKLAVADLIFANGLGLEHGPSLQKNLTSNPNTVHLGERILQEQPELVLYYGGQKDPHIWMDVSLWSQAIPFIVQSLSLKDPMHAEYFASNGQKLKERLDRLHHEILEKTRKIPENKRYLVTSHDAFHYFARAYFATDDEIKDGSWEKRFAAPEGLAPESQISVKNVQDIIDHLAKYDIHVLFSESNVSKDSISKIIDAGKRKGLDLRISLQPLYADAMGEKGSNADTYEKMIQYNVDVIADTLNKVDNRMLP